MQEGGRKEAGRMLEEGRRGSGSGSNKETERGHDR